MLSRPLGNLEIRLIGKLAELNLNVPDREMTQLFKKRTNNKKKNNQNLKAPYFVFLKLYSNPYIRFSMLVQCLTEKQKETPNFNPTCGISVCQNERSWIMKSKINLV